MTDTVWRMRMVGGPSNGIVCLVDDVGGRPEGRHVTGTGPERAAYEAVRMISPGGNRQGWVYLPANRSQWPGRDEAREHLTYESEEVP